MFLSLLVIVGGGAPQSLTVDAARARIAEIIAASGAEVAVAYEPVAAQGATEPRINRILIDEEKVFHAASTMKVPVMIEAFRQADEGRFSLDDAIPVGNTFKSIVDGSLYELSATEDSDGEVYKAIGKAMTVRQLVTAAITVSSNLATNILIEKLGPENVRKTVARLEGDGMVVLRGVEDQKAFDKGMNNATTARALMALLGAIARGQAVNAAASRGMSDILRMQQFNDAIPAGLPADVPVGHKTGNITRIHHDAAIVYAEKPYVLVVLTRGIDDQKKSAKVIADISRVIYAVQR
ncbi:MAG: class A beta-lactamase-related serine hydrolase [Acidobacteriota bacterium]|nr:class A beta-lactamase-related serine hydrolase [Acidobacteriota bacterium]